MWFFVDLLGLAFGPVLRRCSGRALVALWQAVRVIVVELVVAVVLEMFAEANSRPASAQVVVVG